MVQNIQENLIVTIGNMRLILIPKKNINLKEVCARMVARNLSSKQKIMKCTFKL